MRWEIRKYDWKGIIQEGVAYVFPTDVHSDTPERCDWIASWEGPNDERIIVRVASENAGKRLIERCFGDLAVELECLDVRIDDFLNGGMLVHVNNLVGGA